jgi:WD40 repeat protein
LLAIDLKNQKVLWHTDQVDLGNIYQAENRTLAIGNHGQSLYLVEKNFISKWRLMNGERSGKLIENTGNVKFLQSSRDGSLLVAGFSDNTFSIWSTSTDKLITHFTVPSEISCLAISPNNKKIALLDFYNRKFIVCDLIGDVHKEFPVRVPYASTAAYRLCWSPDGRQIAANIDTYPSCIVFYDAETWKPLARWQCGAVGSRSLFAFDSRGILFEYMDGTLTSLDVNSIKSLAQ